jgi:hypothetical protein
MPFWQDIDTVLGRFLGAPEIKRLSPCVQALLECAGAHALKDFFLL